MNDPERDAEDAGLSAPAAAEMWNDAAALINEKGLAEAESARRLLRELEERAAAQIERRGRASGEGPEGFDLEAALSDSITPRAAFTNALRHGERAPTLLQRRRWKLEQRRRFIEEASLYSARHGFPEEVPNWEKLTTGEQENVLEKDPTKRFKEYLQVVFGWIGYDHNGTDDYFKAIAQRVLKSNGEKVSKNAVYDMFERWGLYFSGDDYEEARARIERAAQEVFGEKRGG